MAVVDDMRGKVCVITGATAGIGRETALKLGARSAIVVAIGRDRQRGEALVAAIRESGGNAAFFAADLASRADIRRLCDDLLAAYPRLDVLINNAGVMCGHRQLSVDGIEMTFAVNHLSYFLLANRLLPALAAADGGRIVIVASEAHRGEHLDFADLQMARRFRGWKAYKRSKLANLLFTYELARRLDGSGVTVNALHPGFVRTGIGVNSGWTSRLAWRAMTTIALPIDAGAVTSVYLASAAEVAGVSGGYFIKGAPARSSAESYDVDAARRLWDVSAGLTGGDHRPS